MMAGTIDHTMPSRSAADTSSASVPGEQFPIRRRAYQRIKELFDLNGVKFAVPKVQVAEGEEGVAASAVSNLRPISTTQGTAQT
jgi:small-conductance mechanosensitive channel